jgi:hypothetical protein
VGSQRGTWKEHIYASERARTLKSRLFVLLRDELGLARQPKVARLLVDEILRVVDDTLVSASTLEPGQALVLCPELGQGPSWTWRRLEDKKLKTVRLTLVAQDDVERLAAGEHLAAVRKRRMARLAQEAYGQGATVTTCQLALLTGISPSRASAQLNEFMKETNEILPLRGIVEDCSPAITHKAAIVARHLQGESTAEIARATNHTPRSVERYLARFEQVRELVRYLDRTPDSAVIARILRCSPRLVRAYLELLPAQEHPPVAPATPPGKRASDPSPAAPPKSERKLTHARRSRS